MADGKKRAPKLTVAQRMALDRRDDRLDWSRAEGIDGRDPRARGAPCYGRHDPLHPQCRVANQHMVKYKCVNCTIQMLYIPRFGCTGQYRKPTELQKNHNPAGRKMKTGIPEDTKIPQKDPPRQPSPKPRRPTKPTSTSKGRRTRWEPPPRPRSPPRKARSPSPTRSVASEHSEEGDYDEPSVKSVSREPSEDDTSRGMPSFNPKKESKKEFQKRLEEWMKTVPSDDDGSDSDKSIPKDEDQDPAKQWALLEQDLNMEIEGRAKRERERGSRGSDSSAPATPRKH